MRVKNQTGSFKTKAQCSWFKKKNVAFVSDFYCFTKLHLLNRPKSMYFVQVYGISVANINFD
jgi:hypothetical protein